MPHIGFPLEVVWNGNDKTGYTGYFTRFPKINATGNSLRELMDNLGTELDKGFKRIQYHKSYLENNKEHLKQIKKEWAKKPENAEKIKAIKKQWNDNNKHRKKIYNERARKKRKDKELRAMQL